LKSEGEIGPATISNLLGMKEGDIYQTILSDGRFGAVKVLKTGGKFDFSPKDFHLIGVTPFVSVKPHTIDNPFLKEILIREFSFPKGYKVINIYCGTFPKELKYLGNIPVSEELSKLKIEIGDGTNGGFPSCGEIPLDIGYEALIEWRYKYDREAFLRAVEISRQEHSELMKRLHSNKPKKMLDDERFWKIISLLNWVQDNDEKVLEPAVNELSKLTIVEIKNFEETLAFKLFQLDTKEHAKHIGDYAYDEKENYFSDDTFLYARCAVIANGRFFYERAINQPPEMIKNIEFEALLSLASDAYKLKTGKEFEYNTGVSYETYSNSEGWK